MRTCTVCSHKKRADIDAALVAGQSLRAIAGRFRVSRSALDRHRGHLSETVAKAHEAAEVARADSLLDQVKAQRDRVDRLAGAAEGLLQKALADDDRKAATDAIRAACTALREQRGVIELLGKVAGTIQEAAAVQINLQAVRMLDLSRVDDADLKLLAEGDEATFARVLDGQRERTPAEARALARQFFGDVGPQDDAPPRIFLPNDDIEVAQEASRRGIAVPQRF